MLLLCTYMRSIRFDTLGWMEEDIEKQSKNFIGELVDEYMDEFRKE